MSLRDKLSKYMNNHAETNDTHWDNQLQTRYYKSNKDKAMDAVKGLFQDNSLYEINAISEEHGEISVHVKKGKKAFIVATVIMVRPFRTAVDFSVTTESVLPIDFGYSARLITQLYEQLNNELPLLNN
ncbi:MULTISPECIES: cytosolic protein [unclassified Virgibacillus]|uniref:cytosolic protein n=1 Tax=unclassified Virgibacillus TaxID=2620237 RepID=UPI0024DE5999|nr:cytosolic protein [Virgibacillus sp. LDC-1]